MRLLTALLAASLPLLGDGRAQLLPAGPFKARDGRPGPDMAWELADDKGPAVAEAVNRVAALTPIVIDYEHQTFHKEANGQPAPAAGWIKKTEWLSGKGLVATVDWTPRARRAIEEREYQFISPVIEFDEDTGAVTGLKLAALTNYPAVLGMDAAVAALNAQLSPPTRKEPDMALLAALLTAIGLPANTSEADALAAVATLKTTAEAARTSIAALSTELGVTPGTDLAATGTAALTAVKTLKTGTGKGDANAATVALVAQLTGQVAELTARLNGDQVTKAVDDAIAANKLTAGQRDQYIELGKKDFAMLTAVLAVTPVIPGLKGQSPGAAGDQASGVAALTTTQLGIARQLGLDPEAYAKSLKAAA